MRQRMGFRTERITADGFGPGIDRYEGSYSAVSDGAPIACRHCGYDLRGSSLDRTCPECATPVSDSIDGDRLASADPGWLTRVSRGVRRIVTSCALLVVVTALVIVIDTVFDRWLDQQPVVRRLLQDVPMLAVLLLLLLGVLDVVAQEPRLMEREQPTALRRMAAATAIATIPLLLLQTAFGEPAIQWALGAALGATIALVGLHLAALAQRMPDDHLESRCRTAAKTFAGCAGIFIALRAIEHLAGPLPLIAAVTGLTGLLLLASTIRSVLAWRAFGRRLDEILLPS